MDFVSLCNLFVDIQDTQVYFFNVKTWNVLIISRDLLDEYEENKESDDPKFDDIKEVVNNHDYILFPTLSINEFVRAKRIFILKYFSKLNNPFEDFLDDSKSEKDFLSRVEELNLFDKWEQVLQDEVKCSVYRYLLNNTDNLFDYLPKYTYALKSLKSIYLLKMWNYFTDEDLIKISVGDVSIYIDVLGSEGKCYGYSIYHGEDGLCDYQSLKEFVNKENSSIVMSLQNCLTVYFNKYQDLNDEELVIIKKSRLEFEEGEYPSILMFNEGRFPSNNINIDELRYLENVNQVLFDAMYIYLQEPLALDFTSRESLLIEVGSDNKLKLSPYKQEDSKNISTYGFDYEENKALCLLNDDSCYEVKVDCLYAPYIDGDTKYWIYVLIVIDSDSELIVHHDQQMYSEENKAFTLLKENLNKFALENGFASKVSVSDFFSYQLVKEGVGCDLDIEIEEPSEMMKEIISGLHSLELNEEEEKEVAYMN